MRSAHRNSSTARPLLNRFGLLILRCATVLRGAGYRRATRDVDMLALQTDNDPAAVQRLIVDVASVELDDGVEFLQGTLTASVIRDDDVYPGVRASLEARLATARIKFSVDFNVGDPLVPAPVRTAIPVLLGGEPLEVLSYPKVDAMNCERPHAILQAAVQAADASQGCSRESRTRHGREQANHLPKRCAGSVAVAYSWRGSARFERLCPA